MSHARIQFDLDRDADGTIHLRFFDALGDVGDTILVVNADGTLALSDYNISDDDKWMDAPEILTPIPNIHTFLAELYEKGEGR